MKALAEFAENANADELEMMKEMVADPNNNLPNLTIRPRYELDITIMSPNSAVRQTEADHEAFMRSLE